MSSILGPVHLLAYSTLLGTELYQSFVMTKVAYQALPRSAFTSLQKRVFPIYFQSQSLLLLLAAVSIPPHGLISLFKEKSDWIPFAVAGITAGLNLVVYGPRTKELMIEKVHQATRDVDLELSTGTVSESMKKLNRSFSRAHAMSIHLNLVAIGATLWYGWRLASRLRFDTK
ncbi:uncharacterized protein K460DRAFT_309327 [Cucurbitaria berberidis CBS 394.84]|uniref:TMEM205-like domain-containing protein n=1 Tax=Cucurbitaria berberidis CBS 394.84 TaxID=1168544 RepID=A0A9P4GP14_9PLEO|nr:uncharacterized protein K460DRAFT_309327 [Cucurbitaria berberidis CBS 394.84]KAF1848712.1 hypothetical protein K460DRAFT_309327 [Cucurbitaria berberidis CBS 394.84]